MMLLLKGFIIGFAVAAPIGPVGLLCIRRSIADGRLAGFVTGLGAAIADAFMALVAAFGVTTILSFVDGHRQGFQLVGGLLLLLMGIGAMRAAPPSSTRSQTPIHAPSLIKAFLSTIALTLANPVTIASLLAIFAAFGVSLHTQGLFQPSWLVFGVFLGSTAWWIILSWFAEWFGRKLNTHLLKTINVGTGVLLILIGVYQLVILVASYYTAAAA
jgi:threonine/homoserine/homoserine lactone efflux protein